ncbi:MAG: DNA internalization-related competence protein ComEC/Rec2 [Oscillospiraceae bacterium]|nr:DNA internalization-related competence protein ComEC/Rec2 [Oscillospiraceae bacterium]
MHITVPLKFAAIKTDDSFDKASSYGVYSYAYVTDEYVINTSRFSTLIHLQKSAADVFKKTVYNCFPEDVAPFTAALLTGGKTQLYKDTALYSDLATAGLAHIVAVSGMHLSFITGFCRMITGRRRRTAFICIPIIVAFMALVGFTPSVVRAGIMQIIILTAPMLRRESDSLTSLAFAFLILTLNPQAITSVSLQLSFAATAGIVLLTGPINKHLTKNLDFKFKPLEKLVRALIGIFSCSVGALAFTTPLCAFHFSYISLYGIISNLLCIWLLTAAFILSLLTTVIGLAFPEIAAFIAGIIAYLPRLVFAVSGFIADLPYARLYTANSYIALWVAFSYAIFIASYLAKGERKYRPIIPVCCCICSLCIITMFDTARIKDCISVTAVDVGQGQSITVLTENSTVVIDCGSKTEGSECAQLTAEELFSQGRQHIDLLILTHLHTDHANGAAELMNLVHTSAVAMPESALDSEYYDEIVSLAETEGIEIYYITEDTSVSFGDVSYTLYAPLGKTHANENGIIVLGDYGEFEFLVTGDVNTDTENILCLTRELPDIEMLVAGHHGSKYSCGEMLLAETLPESVIISVGYNSYGHPSMETLERITLYGAEISRTDTGGSINITVGKDNG